MAKNCNAFFCHLGDPAPLQGSKRKHATRFREIMHDNSTSNPFVEGRSGLGEEGSLSHNFNGQFHCFHFNPASHPHCMESRDKHIHPDCEMRGHGQTLRCIFCHLGDPAPQQGSKQSASMQQDFEKSCTTTPKNSKGVTLAFQPLFSQNLPRGEIAPPHPKLKLRHHRSLGGTIAPERSRTLLMVTGQSAADAAGQIASTDLCKDELEKNSASRAGQHRNACQSSESASATARHTDTNPPPHPNSDPPLSESQAPTKADSN